MAPRRFRPYGWIAVVALLAFVGLIAGAGASGLDNSFGDRGIAVANFSDMVDEYVTGTSVVAQSDGKTLVAGGGDGLTFARFDGDGSPDQGFGTDGKSIIRLPGSASYQITDLAQAKEGSVIALGEGGRPSTRDEAFIFRLSDDGSLDPTFGEGGVATVQLPENARMTSLTFDSAGRMVIGGTTELGDGLVLRAKADGSLDRSFATKGFKQIDLNDTTALSLNGNGIGDLTLDGRGRIVIAATLTTRRTRRSTRETDIVAIRLKPSGKFDRSLNHTGERRLHVDPSKATATETDDDYATGVIAQGDRIVIAGGVHFNRYRVAALALRDNGQLDRSFSKDGVQMLNVTSKTHSNSRFLEASGLLSAGHGEIAVTGQRGKQLASWYLGRSGKLGKIASTRLNATVVRPAIDRRGRVLIGGTDYATHDNELFAARFKR